MMMLPFIFCSLIVGGLAENVILNVLQKVDMNECGGVGCRKGGGGNVGVNSASVTPAVPPVSADAITVPATTTASTVPATTTASTVPATTTASTVPATTTAFTVPATTTASTVSATTIASTVPATTTASTVPATTTATLANDTTTTSTVPATTTATLANDTTTTSTVPATTTATLANDTTTTSTVPNTTTATPAPATTTSSTTPATTTTSGECVGKGLLRLDVACYGISEGKGAWSGFKTPCEQLMGEGASILVPTNDIDIAGAPSLFPNEVLDHWLGVWVGKDNGYRDFPEQPGPDDKCLYFYTKNGVHEEGVEVCNATKGFFCKKPM